ncbi:MAG: hypothetical protein U0667_17420 [Chloroflexota bacterium]
MTGLAALVRGLAALRASQPPRLLAVGWATVDLGRTLDDLGVSHRPPTVDEPLLGARGSRVDAGPVAVIVLEPSTEGRLAAALARRGEGVCALYVGATAGPSSADRATALGLPGRLLPHDHPWGPFVIEVPEG